VGVEIKLTDKELPISPAMIEFLDRHISGRPHGATWADQLSETLVPTEAEQRFQYAQSVADKVLQDPLGQQAIYRAYDLLAAISIGTTQKLKPLHERYRFICVVGCPRHGGSYLTRELFLALGHDPARVPNEIAHDGFPNLTPYALDDRYNAHTSATQQTAEYLAMVEVYFAKSRRVDGYTIVPKKATKAVYQGAFFNAVLGPGTEYVVTLRHPVAACISTYEKSTGLPLDGRFDVRGNIEEWVKRDLMWLGADEGSLLRGDYFDVYLRYWENYHCLLALSGLAAARRNWTVVAYGKERLMALARRLHERFGSAAAPGEFKVFDKRSRHPEWNEKAGKAIERVAQVWKLAGLEFPVGEVMEGW
jgi:hypothetical protein